MKFAVVFKAGLICSLGTVLFPALPAYGDVGTDMVKQALDLVHQAWNPGGDPPSNEERTNLLNQAMKLAQNSPNHHMGGHREMAILDISAALIELKNSTSDSKAVHYIQNADQEFRAAIRAGR